MVLYQTYRRKLNRLSDDYHRMLCIVRAIDKQFHVSPEILGVSDAKYRNYFQQLEKAKVIVRVEGEEYLAECYNVCFGWSRSLAKKVKSIAGGVNTLAGGVQGKVEFC
ncbi:MAG: hypothetical protein LKM30_03500 [Bacilli bacterium]|jgi:hypothetical protein|nr:hypothetical protein [Bacilli bacterium]